MREVILRLGAAAVFVWPACAMAQLDSITQREAVAGLKAALERGSQKAVAQPRARRRLPRQSRR